MPLTHERKFDWDEATRRYRKGESPTELAAEYGVTPQAIHRIVVPGCRDRDNARKAVWQRQGVCVDCGGPCTYGTRPRAFDVLLCMVCAQIRKRTRFSERNGVVFARCFTCGKDKLLDEFPGDTHYKDVRPKGVHGTCRSCHTAIKRAYRAAHPEYNKRQAVKRMERYRQSLETGKRSAA